MLSEAPEGLDAVNVVLAPSEFVLVVMNTMMSKSAGHQAIAGPPAVSVNVTLGKDVSLEDRHQFSLGAVRDDADEDSISTLVKAQDGRFTTGPSSSLASNPAGSEVAFINLDISSKRLQLPQRQVHDSFSKQRINPMHRSVVKPA